MKATRHRSSAFASIAPLAFVLGSCAPQDGPSSWRTSAAAPQAVDASPLARSGGAHQLGQATALARDVGVNTHSFSADEAPSTSNRAETTPDPRGADEVSVSAPADSPLGAPLHADVTVRNVDTEARDFTVYVLARMIAENGNEFGVIAGPQTTAISLAAGGSATVGTDVPWAAIQPLVGQTDFVQFDVVVTRVHDTNRWFKERVVRILELPVTLTMTPPDRVAVGNTATVSVTYSNPLTIPLTGAVLTIGGGSGLLLGGTERSEEIPIGTIAPGASATVTRFVTATLEDRQSVSAYLYAENAVPGEDSTSVTTFICTADFNHDGFVNTQDFFDFNAAFNGGAPSADFNHDGFVNSVDFFGFLDAFFVGC